MGVGLQVQCNNPDVVTNVAPLAANGTRTHLAANCTLLVLQLKALRAGKALVCISLSHAEHLDDYISVRISNAIVPLVLMVHTGGHVQFAVTFMDVS